MKKVELVGLAGILNNRGVKNTKRILNNYLYFLAENKAEILDINTFSGHINIQYRAKTGKKTYNLYLDNTFLKSNKTLASVYSIN